MSNYQMAIYTGELKARIVPSKIERMWSFTLFNDEVVAGPHHIHTLHLAIKTPFTIITSPTGWAFDTDNSSFVLFYSTSPQFDIPPGSSLSTFKVETASDMMEPPGFTITSWNHLTDAAGLGLIGAFEITAPSAISISGKIIYGATPAGGAVKYVPGVTVTATGSPQVTATSDGTGSYQLNGLGTGNYTVTLAKTGDVNSINSLDATRIQQHLVGLITLTPHQLIAADTNNSGNVNSLDATRIQQHLVGIQSTHIIGQWKFVPANKQYSSLTGELTGENYVAILVGEVSGNWTAPAVANAGAVSTDEAMAATAGVIEGSEQTGQTSAQTNKSLVGRITGLFRRREETQVDLSAKSRQPFGKRTSITVDIQTNRVEGRKGEMIEIPIEVGDLTDKGIFSYDFAVFYDPSVLRPARKAHDTDKTVSSGMSVLSNSPLSGRLLVSAAGANEIAGGTLLYLRFDVIGEESQQTDLSFTDPQTGENTFRFADGKFSAKTSSGDITVTADSEMKLNHRS
jgi:hypothetical protein